MQQPGTTDTGITDRHIRKANSSRRESQTGIIEDRHNRQASHPGIADMHNRQASQTGIADRNIKQAHQIWIADRHSR